MVKWAGQSEVKLVANLSVGKTTRSYQVEAATITITRYSGANGKNCKIAISILHLHNTQRLLYLDRHPLHSHCAFEEEDKRHDAIQNMAYVYGAAKSILVIDESLADIRFDDVLDEEFAVRILISP
ncbi:uncharacterized protein Z519_00998 [Cladophialophora bantiana CBS 173.52]|uniref:Uncharacterized protein n=1 Tax=Cladophialophora bantiana (strain ATCC 10958 / CBS 173.52 / CDC B-1940 / NIH 8579) TaxID=1442370 RepID=A0A0D2I7W3_CLAB1|nr:uncharacterized protein Z519_00998 [Cladophialophora bantiana CBS 173.52]KIW99335.1 hypothetical protein Z519_00998 [Cladophialophora bantiana CBS 173.52]